MGTPALKRMMRQPATAYIGPMVVFQLLLALVPLFAHKHPSAPWYVQMPQHWIYPLQTVLCGAMIAVWWKHYEWTNTTWRNVLLGLICGVVGIALWIAPTEIYYRLTAAGAEIPEWWEYLGVREREDGFDPYLVEWSGWAIALRLIRMTIVVAFVEEFLWRGFLMRYLVDMDKPFTSTPFGTHNWRVFGIVTFFVVIVHQPADYFVAALWGALVYWVAVKTKSLAACVAMHAVANLVLGVYILQTGHNGLW
ncbi:CAAX prenyl protease-related protein [Sulfuriroseicoccus oceanibius]|uniref:CAAX prenyl protease-related protein n=1 Tax=Sulfuriroseicoccus oceanibius TaxID=2707525 RepID=A0A6B3L8D3_9BACT|nr:CAAX prenyl protease-related protein [Sulfuriroseicoccus oceanibius]QQL43770.1 CAAX prenyl protease-related protein [Sulfuriroseicoccus oceanibius]